jgi:gamma-glutamylcyclotransferase (GGCT)/AIG2-like uncharacterized protein YtfP
LSAKAPVRLLAAYGSLRRGLAGYRKLNMERALRYLGPCLIPGRLYDLGSYPGLVAGDGEVVGELFEMRNDVVLRRLDVFEGFDARRPADSLFTRERVQLVEPDVDAWVYFHNRPKPSDRPVASGDWVEHRRLTGRR